MHYIVGTHIPPQTAVVSQNSPRVKSVGQPQLNRRIFSNKFAPDASYSIYHIYKKDDKFVYVFAESDTDNRVEVSFDSTRGADVYIARLIGEKLPDKKSR